MRSSFTVTVVMHDAVARRQPTGSLLVEHLLVRVAAGNQVAIGHQDEVVAQRKRAVLQSPAPPQDRAPARAGSRSVIGVAEGSSTRVGWKSVETSAIAVFSPTTKTCARSKPGPLAAKYSCDCDLRQSQ
jgi:hypothetical protein